MQRLDDFFNSLWQQYIAITPQALAIHDLLKKQGEVLVNDHVAFRTFSHSAYSIEQLEPQLLSLGFSVLDNYQFKKKKLSARCYIHKDTPTKIFVSELLWQELPKASKQIVEGILHEGTSHTGTSHTGTSQANISISCGRLWCLPSYQNYKTLLKDSEYAAWLSVWGLRVNHFTIHINYLKKYNSLEKVVSLLRQYGYLLNEEGGVIKGSEEDCLIQTSTMADKQELEFLDAGEQLVSSCYYEFAQRFKQKNGEIFEGFVPSSADKIFESTNELTPVSTSSDVIR